MQFRWAWQNTHLTKRIAEEQRLTARETKVKRGRTRKHPARPRTSLIDKLSNLHLLLRVPSFARWPLEVRFFCKDVYEVWSRWSERVNGEIGPCFKVFLDAEQPVEPLDEPTGPLSAEIKRKRKQEAIRKGGIYAVDVGYSKLKDHVKKSLVLLAKGEANSCAICAENIEDQSKTILVCSLATCRAVFHMTCLAQSFLDKEQHENAVIPISGKCQQCKSELQWVDLVKEMSLRLRGEAEIAKLLRKPKVPKAKTIKGKEGLLADAAAEPTVDEADEDYNHNLEEDDSDTTSAFEEPLPDDWHFQENDGDDNISITSETSNASAWLDPISYANPIDSSPRLEVVIDDSDWDDVEVLD